MTTGHWVKIEPFPMQMYDYECSECGHETNDFTAKFCSECGAKMEVVHVKKVFISQPMKDRSVSEILMEEKRVIQKLYDMGYKSPAEISIIDSIIISEAPPDNYNKELWYLARAIENLAGADIAVFTKGWQKSIGCQIELTCVKEYGIEYIICEDDE